MKTKKYYFAPIAFLLALVFILPFFLAGPVQPVSAAGLTSASGMCVLEKGSGRVLYSSNMNSQRPMASTTKIMTLITVLQNCDDPDEFIQVDDAAIGVEGTSIYLRKGEIIQVRELLYGLMLRSGNDAAVALACHVGGSIEGFANMMNELAIKIGAVNSHFNNPHGLDDKNHYTTAYDLALITAYAMNNPIFKEVVSTKSFTIGATNLSDTRYLTNKNKLLTRLDGCCGVKTGYTSKAGRCLVSACERGDMMTICVVLNCGPMFEESVALLNASHNEFKNTIIVDKNREFGCVNSLDGNLYAYVNADFSFPLRAGEIEDVSIDYNITKENCILGDEVGEVYIYFKGEEIASIKLYAMNKIDKMIENNEIILEEF